MITTIIFSVLFLYLGFYFTNRISYRITQIPTENLRIGILSKSTKDEVIFGSINYILVWVVVFFSLFLGSFFILGFIGLVIGKAIITPPAVMTVLLVAGISFITLVERGAGRSSQMKFIQQIWREIKYGFTQFSIENMLLWLTLITFLGVGILLTFGLPKGYESHAYVLPYAVHIFQAKSLLPWSDAFMFTFPANQSIYDGFFLNFLPENLTSIVNLPFLIPLVIALYGVSRILKANHSSSLFAALGILSVPIVGLSAFKPYPDLTGLTFLAIAIYFVLARPNTAISCFLLSGLAIGLAFGFKAVHLVSVVFLALAIFVHELILAASKQKIYQAFIAVLKYSTGFALLSSYWLIRNYVLYGNPLYPASLPLVSDFFGWPAGVDVNVYDLGEYGSDFQWVRYPAEWIVYPWTEWGHISDQSYTARSGVGALFSTCLLPTLLACAMAMLSNFNKEKSYPTSGNQQQLPEWLTLSTLLLGFWFVVLCWWLSNNHQPRYFIGLFAFFSPLVAYMLNHIVGLQRRIAGIISFACIALMYVFFTSKEIFEFGSHIMLSSTPTRYSILEYPEVIDRLPSGSKIINLVDRPSNYSLFGDHLQNQVVDFMASVAALAPDIPAIKRYGTDPIVTSFDLCCPSAMHLNATHLYTFAGVQIKQCKNAALFEIARYDKNPVNNVPLPNPRVLYEIVKAR